MVEVEVCMRATGEPLKRTPILWELDAQRTPEGATDRDGKACFAITAESGKVLVSGIERYYDKLRGKIEIALLSITEHEDSSAGNLGEFPSGGNAYADMPTRALGVGEHLVETDSEGFLVNPLDWSEDFVRAQAAAEGLTLQTQHWAMIRYLREHFRRRGTQASVRDMIKHFRAEWGHRRGAVRRCIGYSRAGDRRSKAIAWQVCCVPRASTEALSAPSPKGCPPQQANPRSPTIPLAQKLRICRTSAGRVPAKR